MTKSKTFDIKNQIEEIKERKIKLLHEIREVKKNPKVTRDIMKRLNALEQQLL